MAGVSPSLRLRRPRQMPGLTEQTPAFAGYETLETGQGEAFDPLPVGQPSALPAGQQGGQTAREGGRPLFWRAARAHGELQPTEV